MASRALAKWWTTRRHELDQLLRAHRKLGGDKPGRRYATEQLNYAYLVAIAAQFQGFCRDLHSEAVVVLTAAIPSPEISTIMRATLTKGRKLDQGNATDATIAEDFARIGMTDFWVHVAAQGGEAHTKARRKRLEQMNLWRNAIAHDNFEHLHSRVDKLDRRLRPRLIEAHHCREACTYLAAQMDAALASHLAAVVEAPPW